MENLTLIIGKHSNLSQKIATLDNSCILISSRDFMEDNSILLMYKNNNINLIFNNFQPAKELSKLENPRKYIEATIYNTSKVLEILIENDFKIKKIIYTSSSSVYGDNILCKETDELKPNSLHASLKLANEKLIETFCVDYNIEYALVRLFNMYGGDDEFSIISKIIKAYQNSEVLTVVNNGNAIRDFIHIEDVVKIYFSLIKAETMPHKLNIGTGIGNSVRGIIEYLDDNSIHLETKNIIKTEIKVSTANIELLESLGFIDGFIDVKSFILKALKAK